MRNADFICAAVFSCFGMLIIAQTATQYQHHILFVFFLWMDTRAEVMRSCEPVELLSPQTGLGDYQDIFRLERTASNIINRSGS